MNLSILNTAAFCIMDIKILACVGEGRNFNQNKLLLQALIAEPKIPILFTDRVASGQGL